MNPTEPDHRSLIQGGALIQGTLIQGTLIRSLHRHLLRRRTMGQRRIFVGGSIQDPAPLRETTAGESRPNPRPDPHPVATPQAAPRAAGPVAAWPRTAAAQAPPLPPSAPQEPARTAPRTPTEAVFSSEVAAKCLSLEQLRGAVAGCQACSLGQTRTQTVFADGSAQPGGIFFVGEAPGADEDRTGVPFVGKAGQLLTDIINKGMGLRRDQVTIANVLKCRPPGNRDPLPEEKELCTPFLDRQIELVQPAVIVALGTHAAQHLLGTNAPISALRGQIHARKGLQVVPTFHPAFLLRNPERKRDCWLDIQLAMKAANLPLPGSGKPSAGPQAGEIQSS